MSADLHIHVIPTDEVSGTAITWESGAMVETRVTGMVDDNVLSVFFSSTVGSGWSFGWRDNITHFDRERAHTLVVNTPSVWIGEVSWLKAALFDDSNFVPEPVSVVSDIIGNKFSVIDDVLIERVKAALQTPNTTGYSVTTRVDDIVDFLTSHKGLRCFTVSW